MENRGSYRYDADLIKYINHVFESYPGELVFERFLAHLNGESNTSERTKKLYINDLFGNYPKSSEYTFFTFICIRNIASYDQITRDIIREFIVWLVSHHIAKSSVNRKLSALRCFYEFLIVEKIVTSSPIPIRTHQRNSPRSNLTMKMEQRLPVFLTLPEITKILTFSDSSKPTEVRDKAMLELMYASGMRVSELCRLDLINIDLGDRKIRVIGKGSKEREVLIGIPAEKALREYLSGVRPKLVTHNNEKALFLNNKGNRLSVRWVQIQLKHYALANGIEKNVHPHVLRHTFATHMLDGGADLRVVQELLGHADLSSTQIYTHVTNQQARKVYLNTHPMAQEKDNQDAKQSQTG